MVGDKDLRIFGLIWALILSIFASFVVENQKILTVLYSLIFFFLASCAICPKLYLKIKIYQGWIKIGNFIGRINSFLIIVILFYLLFTPIGLILRLFGNDLLAKKLDSQAKSYFVDRKTQPCGMENQF